MRDDIPAMSRAQNHDTASRRTSPRLGLTEVSCEQGTVCDVSLTGMQVSCPGAAPVGMNEPVRFHARCYGKQIAIEGNVVWIKRPGKVFGPSRFGVRFIEPGGIAAKALMHLANVGVWPEKLEAGTSAPSAPEPERDTTNDAPDDPTVQIEVIDLYALLGVEQDADERSIRTAYRTKVKQWHPDTCDDPQAAIRLEMVVGASRVLLDTQARREYDLRRAG